MCVCFCVRESQVSQGEGWSKTAQVRLFLARAEYAWQWFVYTLSKHADNGSRWERDRCRAGSLQQPCALTGLPALGVNTVLSNTQPDGTTSMSRPPLGVPRCLRDGLFTGGLQFVRTLKWACTVSGWARMWGLWGLAQRGASMPLVIINQRDVKPIITFHMVRKLLQHIYYHSQH